VAVKQATDISSLGRSLVFRPDADHLRELTAQMTSARETIFGNLNVQSRVGARQRSSTFIVTDEPERYSEQTMRHSEGRKLARLQDEYLATKDLVVVDGYLGNEQQLRMSARLIVEKDYANIAAMQRLLYIEPVSDGRQLDPDLTVICTPGLEAEGYKNNRAIACWLEEGVTRVINTDYFDEAKKAGLRMWSSSVYQSGGLVLHSGCKVVPSRRGLKSVLVLGLPDSGKSTITFTQHNGSRVVQDDFIALFDKGRILSPQDGCIEKTYGLDPKLQPEIYAAATHPEAYMENVLQRGNLPDFSREADRRAGRAVFNLRLIDSFTGDVPPLTTLLFLMRGDGVLPAVARLSRKDAVKHFLLRELRGWTAKDAHGEGSLPGPRADQSLVGIAQRGERLARLLLGLDFECYLVNTGSVGGPLSDPRAKSIPFSCSLGLVQALVDGTVQWDGAGDLGLDVAAGAPQVDDIDLFQPHRLYERQGRTSEYRDLVQRIKLEWRANIGAVPQTGALSEVLSSSSRGGRAGSGRC
jgi:phosphoenolpyruvate carboxykinase (ATP)